MSILKQVVAHYAEQCHKKDQLIEFLVREIVETPEEKDEVADFFQEKSEEVFDDSPNWEDEYNKLKKDFENVVSENNYFQRLIEQMKEGQGIAGMLETKYKNGKVKSPNKTD